MGGTTKSSRTDIVTEFDRAAEAAHRRPASASSARRRIVGEEGADHGAPAGYAWFIDPIDGTTNFVYDLPAWSCSVAVARRTGDGTMRDEMIAGAVYAPALGEMFTPRSATAPR